jgi:nitrogen regulatory protein PII
MSYLVVFVLDNADRCQNVLNAWEEAGAMGITILESTGIGRVRRSGIRDDLPLMPSLSELLESAETHNRTLFSVVDGLDAAHALVEAAQNTVGDMEEPNSGLIFIAPLVEVYGLNREDRR